MNPFRKALLLLFVICFSLNLQSQSKTPRKSRKAKNAIEAAQRQNIVATAKRYIGTKYLYGGNAPSGFDCSGFVEFVYKKNNIALPRVCSNQKKEAEKKRISKLKPGDLVFFSKGKVKHVGIVVLVSSDELVMIHASNSKGVALTNVYDSRYWKRRLKGGGSYLP